MQKQILPTITEVRLPTRFEFAFSAPGLLVRRISTRGRSVQGNLVPFKTRGDECRRVLSTAPDPRTIIELEPFWG